MTKRIKITKSGRWTASATFDIPDDADPYEWEEENEEMVHDVLMALGSPDLETENMSIEEDA